ncbi:MAG: PKD domain-containing protein [Bacteroidia bacterium]
MKLNLRFLLVGAALALLPFLVNAQVTLPWSEGFENVGSTTTFTSSTTSINGLSHVEYSTGTYGRLRFKAGTGFYNTGSAAATLDCYTSNSTYPTNYLIVEVDLSNYTSANMELSFKFMQHGDESHTNDRVWIRGSSSSSWIQVYDWYTNRGTNGQWNTVSGIDIDNYLSTNSQTPSSTFQIRFGQQDNFPATSTTASDGLTIDDIEIIQVVPNNGTIISVQPFCSGTSDVNVVLENPGSNSITSGQISWSVNGTAQTAKRFTSSIPSKGSGVINLGSYSFTGSGPFSFVFNIDSINGVRDSVRSNDTLRTSGNSAFSGTYSVGGSGADYSTFNAAYSALKTNGICGPVTFRVNSGTFTEQLVLEEITGASATNTIRFVGQGASSTTLSYSTTSWSNYATVTFDGGDYYIFDSMTVKAASSGSGYGSTFWFLNDANYNTIENCTLESDKNSTSSARNNVVFSNSRTSLYTAGQTGSYDTLRNNQIIGGYSGIWNRSSLSSTSTTWTKGLHIEGNTLSDNYYYAMYLFGTSEKNIIGNTLNSPSYSATWNYTYYANYGAGDSIVQNKFYAVNAGTAVYMSNINRYGATTADSFYFINNHVAGGASNSIYATYCYRGLYYNNSFVSSSSDGAEFVFPSGSRMLNNTFQNTGTGYAFYCSSSSAIAAGDLDYNNYFAPNATNQIYYQGTFSNLGTWLASHNTQNNSSLSSDPQHNSTSNPFDLNTLSPNLNNKGLSLTKVAVDIDGNKRPSAPDVTPDIGANEYYLPPFDLDIISMTPTVFSKGNNVISITVRNTGINAITNDTAYVSYARGSETATLDSIFISSLAIGSDTSFTFATPLSVTADTSFTICASIDGGITGDPDATDEICQSVCVGASGVYVIDAAGNGDFTTFGAAYSSLSGCGISGPVTFRVKGGTYTERLVLSELSGVSATNYVRFVGDGSVTLQNTATGTANWATVLLDGADYFYFDSLTVKGIGSSYANAFWFTNGANNNKVTNSKLEVNGTNFNQAIVVFSGSTTSLYTSAITGEYNEFDNNTFSNGGSAIYMRGGGSSNYIYGNKFSNNDFSGQNSYVFYAYYSSFTIENNTIDNIGNNCYPLYSWYSAGNSIKGNRINTNRYGLYSYYENYYVSAVSEISNNMISVSGSVSTTCRPLYYVLADYVNFYHNSVYSDHNNTSASYALAYMSSCDYWNVKNNIFSRENNGYLIYLSTSSSLLGDWHNNNYYSTWSGNEFYFAYSYYNSISALETGRGTWVKNSFDVNPDFVSSTDLHSNSVALNNAGDTTTRITIDFDGETRPFAPDTIPDIGADEYYLPPFDADLNSLITSRLTLGKNAIQVEVKNNGTVTMNNDTIYVQYSVNGSTPVKDTVFTGTLASGGSINYTFSDSFDLTSISGAYADVCVNISPAWKTDPDSTSDSLCVDVCIQGATSATIDAAGNGDFATFAEALDYLNCAGVTAPISILVKDGTYNEKLTIGSIPGASKTNTIRFVGESTNAKLTSTYTAYPNWKTVDLDGAKHIIFDSLTIEATGSSGWAVWLHNAADSNTISNCTINAPSSSSTNTAGIMATASATYYASSGNNANYNNFLSNEFSGGRYGIALYGSSSSRNIGNRIDGNTVRDAYQSGIRLLYQDELKVIGNDVDDLTNTSSGYSFEAERNENSLIMNNFFRSGQYGLRLRYENSLSTSDTSAVVNNMISELTSTFSQYGIYSYFSDDVSYLHNSVWCTHTSSSSSYPAFESYYSDNITVKNNVFASTGGGYSFYYTGGSLTSADYDFNDYYAPNSTNHIYWSGSSYSSVSAWASAQTSYNQNSIEVDPGFISSANLRSYSDNINNKGDNTTTWPTDIDGDPRPTSPDVTVDLGADDFWIPLYDIDVASVDSPDIVITGNNTITATFQNRGLRNLTGERAVVYFTINGGTPTRDTIDFLFLPVGSDTTYSFVSPWNVSTNNNFDICVTADSILGRVSDDPNTECIQRCTGVRDTLWVDPSGNGDYTTIGGAIDKVSCGLTGPSVIYIKNGTYSESVTLSNIKGSSNTNTITIVGESRNGVIWDNDNAYSTILLNDVGNINIENLTIRNTNTNSTSGDVIHLTQANNVSIRNCDIEATRTYTGISAGIAASGNINSIGSSNTQNESITIDSCNISGGYYGIYLFGTGSFDQDSGYVVSNNSILHSRYMSFRTYGIEDAMIDNNYMDSVGFTYGYLMYMDFTTRLTVSNNTLVNVANGIRNYYGNYYSSSDTSTFYNNTIYVNNNNFSAYRGYFQYLSYGQKLYNNTIITTTQSTSSNGSAVYLQSGANGFEFKNNNVIALNNGYLYYNSFSSGISAGAIDHNNWYAPTTFRVYNSGSSYSSLSTWQSSVVNDNQNSVSVDPYFTNYDDFNASSRYLMNAGDSLGVAMDFEGEMRNLRHPDIGADEISKDMKVTMVTYPMNDCRSTGDLDSVKFIFENTGVSSFVEGDTLLVSYMEGSTMNTDTLTVPSGLIFSNGMTSNHSFDSLLNVGNPGNHSMNVWTSYFRDADRNNDTMAHSYFSNPNPMANFTVAEECEYETSEFKDASTVVLGKVTGWDWMFGNGSTSAMQNPDNDYGVYDTFTVRLIATTDSGCVDTTYDEAITHPTPVASYTADDECHHTQTDFTNASSVAYGTLTYAWDMGDNTNTSTQSDPSLTYASDGNYTVELIATSDKGCNDTLSSSVTVHPTPNPDFTATEECLNDVTTFTDATSITSGTYSSSWNFGDNNSSTSASPTHTYASAKTFNVELKTTSTTNGCIDSVTKSVVVNPLPSSIFTATNMCFGDTVPLTNSSTGSGLSYMWYFGDGNTSTDQDPDHVYANSGTYTISLVVTTNKGCTDSSAYSVSVASQPLADFTASNDCVHNNITFTNATSVACGTVSQYLWDFGDGNTQTLTTNSNPSHKYASAGTYDVELVIVLANSVRDTATRSITIFGQPTASFTNTASCEGNLMQFTNTTTAQTGTTLSGFAWTFGNGGTSTLKNPTNTYSTSGTYNVRLIATDSRNCSDTTLTTLSVSPNPSANFTYSNACAYDTVKFANTSSISSGSLTGFSWDFGNNTSASTRQTSNVYGTSGFYQVKMIAESDAGCKDSVTKTVEAYTVPSARFTASNVCDDESMSFNNLSSGASTYAWDFGDMMGTSTTSTPAYTYATDGNYDVELIASTSNGCMDTFTTQVTVYALPTAAFTAADVCDGEEVSFNNTSSGASSYSWSYGDGKGSSLASPKHEYAAANTYTVELIATTSNSCADTVSNSVIVKANPVVSISASDECTYDAVSFSNNTTGASTYAWSFGDGNSSTTMSPNHTYASAGTYNAVLTATSSGSCSTKDSISVEAFPVPSASFTVAAACDGEASSFSNNSSISTGTLNHAWDFGDNSGTSNNTSPTYTYGSANTYTVELISTSNNGCKDTATASAVVNALPTPDFSASNVCLGNAMSFSNNSSGASSYSWDFDDGNSSTSTSPSNTYTTAGKYSVVLTATSSAGCSDDLTKVIEVYSLPTASFTATNECLGDAMSTTNLSSGASTYAWNFGDGNSSTASAPTHTYSASGNYTVTLTATTTNSCTDQTTASISVYSLPVASFSATTVCEGTATSFTNGTSGTNSYNWNFGDGTSSTLSGPSKTYGAFGSYNVTLTATSSEGCVDDSTLAVTVNEQPTAAFTATTECSGDSTVFTNNSTGTITTYAWDFDNGSSSTDMSPKVAYTMGGDYDVELTVATAQGCTDVNTTSVTVYSTPTAAYNVTDACLEDDAMFADNGSNGNGALIADREFHFGDGMSSFGRSANHTYTSADTFTTAMVVTTVNGCTDTATTDVVIFPMPEVMFSGNDTCEFDAISFANNSTITSGTLATYAWNFGDGNSSTDETPAHSFDTLGVYTVEMTATSDNGCASSESITIKIDPKPQALFVATEVCDNDSVRFQNHSGIAKGQLSYEWTFGDGNSSTDEHPWHLFDTFGVYDVTMKVISNKACATEYTMGFEVHAQPIAALPLLPTCVGDSTLVPQAIIDLVNTEWTYRLRTDDTLITTIPEGYLYPAVGIYPTSLYIETPFGCNDSTSTNVVILEVPTLNEWNYTRLENGEMEFSATGESDTLDVAWDFGDGNGANGDVVNYTYGAPGTYEVTCTLTNGAGCTDVITKTVEAFPTGINEFTKSMNFTAYPNPYTNWVKLNYDLSNDAYVRIEIIDMQGRLITTLVDDIQNEGKYIYELNENDLPVAAGNAMVKVIVDNEVLLINLVKLK